jgi:hypothetical protein
MLVLRSALVCAFGLALASLGSVGCTAGTTGEDFDLAGQKPPDGGNRCNPGDTQSCICLGGGMGTQTCRASGASFGPCNGCGTDLPDGLTVNNDAFMSTSSCGTCDGCCNGATCVPLASETNTQCGKRGSTCSACTGSKVCVPSTGSCVDSTGGCTGCAQCCDSATNTCLIDEPNKCGASCTPCSPGTICANGTCTNEIDNGAAFKVVAVSAKVLVNSSCPDNWDYIGEPDPYVCIQYQSGGSLVQGCNTDSYVDGVLSASWNMTTGLMTLNGSPTGTPLLVPASVFTSGKMQILLYDDDNCFNGCVDDLMAQGFFPGKTTYQATYSTGPFGCASDVTFSLVAP